MPVCTHSISWWKAYWTNSGNLASILSPCNSGANWNGKLELSGVGQASTVLKCGRNIKGCCPGKLVSVIKLLKFSCIYTYLHVIYQLEIQKSRVRSENLKIVPVSRKDTSKFTVAQGSASQACAIAECLS